VLSLRLEVVEGTVEIPGEEEANRWEPVRIVAEKWISMSTGVGRSFVAVQQLRQPFLPSHIMWELRYRSLQEWHEQNRQ